MNAGEERTIKIFTYQNDEAIKPAYQLLLKAEYDDIVYENTLDIKTGIPLEGIACISYFYVLPMMRGQKTGSLLAGVVESTFRNGGFPEMYVSANTPEFWKKRGYDHLDKAGESYLLRKVLRP